MTLDYHIQVKIRAMFGRSETEQGYPMTGIVETPEGLYLGMVNGFIPKPEPKRKGRPKTPAEKMRRYCLFLAEWANPATNPRLLESEKADARRRAFGMNANSNEHDAIQRKSQRDETQCMGWLEVLIRSGDAVHEVLVFRDAPTVAIANSGIRITGDGWRTRGKVAAHGSIELSIQMGGDLEGLRDRIARERTILFMPASPDI